MRENFAASLANVLRHEGGFVKHPADPGGATNKGITLASYSKFLAKDATEEELKAIPDRHVEVIYGRDYWGKVAADELPSGLDYCVFDMAVNSGPSRAIKLLQNLVGATPDGVFGPATKRLVQIWYQDRGAANCIAAYNAARQHYVESLPTFSAFGKGWIRRIMEVTRQANALAGKN